MESTESFRICTKGVWDESMPGIKFDDNGVSNYCQIFNNIASAYPGGKKGLVEWENHVEYIKKRGKGKRYDCIIGISGGTDSSYLMHLAKKKYGLRPLAVNLDNGWSSDISVKNIKKVTNKLNIDLETYVIDYEEVKDILRSYMRASLPWIDNPTDQAIKAILYKIAKREGIKYILNGDDFRSEGKQPTEWTYSDSRQLRYLQKKFGTIKIKTFPYLTLFNFVYYGYFRKIKMLRPLFYFHYQKRKAQELLKKEYDWEYYGGHHHENIFTKFVLSYWLIRKFGIDKRKITLSAQVMNGEITREEALQQLSKPPYNPEEMERDKAYVTKKLEISASEFNEIWNKQNKSFKDYPSYYPLIMRLLKIIKPLILLVMPVVPPILFELEERKNN
jgi:N-acetyl sugar amidotransferase